MRANMVEGQIRPAGVTDPRVLAALAHVPREKFLNPALHAVAYMGDELPLQPELGNASARLLAPEIFARLLQLAQIDQSDLVLDVGCGLGYSSAVLAWLAGSVVGLEADEGLATKATQRLAQADIDTVAVVTGPLDAGHSAQAPYDVIVVEQAMHQVPKALLAQLAPGGRLVAIVGSAPVARARIYLNTQSQNDGGEAIASRGAFDVATTHLAQAAPQEFVF
ncbi:MAG: protein-L-isoaspartate O-methyltransferase family protein [Alphaproteobacteria bacterium]